MPGLAVDTAPGNEHAVDKSGEAHPYPARKEQRHHRPVAAHPTMTTARASATWYRTTAYERGYSLDIALTNTGEEILVSWRATLSFPEGAEVIATETSTVASGRTPGVVLVRPVRDGTVAPGHRQVISVDVHCTRDAPQRGRIVAVTGSDTEVTVDITAAPQHGTGR